MAERVGFEPTVGLHLRLISSQVHSTTLPPLRRRVLYPRSAPRAPDWTKFSCRVDWLHARPKNNEGIDRETGRAGTCPGAGRLQPASPSAGSQWRVAGRL